MLIDVYDVIYLVGSYSGTTFFLTTYSLTSKGTTGGIFITSVFNSSISNNVVSLTGPVTKTCNSIVGGAGIVEITGAFTQTIFCYNTPNCGITSAGGSDMFFSGIIFYVMGLKENQKENIIRVYPNPASDILNLDNSMSSEACKIKMIDLLGRTTLEAELSKQINIKEIKAGIYFLQLFDKGN